MFTRLPAFVLGFHGCDKKIAEAVVSGLEPLKFNKNEYDWLGHGIYFWEQNPKRAWEFATEMSRLKRNGRPRIETVAVVGAVIDLGICLNLLDSRHLQFVQNAYETLVEVNKKDGIPMPENRSWRGSKDHLLRELDCEVIETLHETWIGKDTFDTVRAAFVEGETLYPGAGFHVKNHIQICVRNYNCIQGLFHVTESQINSH